MVGIEWTAMGEREQRRQRWGRGRERDVCMGVISFGSFTCCFHGKNLASDRCLFLVHYNSIVNVNPWPHRSIIWPPPYHNLSLLTRSCGVARWFTLKLKALNAGHLLFVHFIIDLVPYSAPELPILGWHLSDLGSFVFSSIR